jgi:hypothetical protein
MSHWAGTVVGYAGFHSADGILTLADEMVNVAKLEYAQARLGGVEGEKAAAAASAAQAAVVRLPALPWTVSQLCSPRKPPGYCASDGKPSFFLVQDARVGMYKQQKVDKKDDAAKKLIERAKLDADQVG